MQIKKEEVKNAILAVAEKEFIDKGFEGASIRNIVKMAGTTIGNFYNYFDSKEMLFDELVKDEHLTFYIENHHNVERPDYLWETTDVTVWRRTLKQFLQDYLPLFDNSFLLIMESAKGTKHENKKEILIEFAKEHFNEHLTRFHSEYINNSAFISLIARQFVEGLIMILKEHKEEDIRKELLTELLLFYFIGVMGLVGDW